MSLVLQVFGHKVLDKKKFDKRDDDRSQKFTNVITTHPEGNVDDHILWKNVSN